MYWEQACPGGSLLFLELHIELGWQENGQVELRIWVKCTEKLSISASLSEPLKPEAVVWESASLQLDLLWSLQCQQRSAGSLSQKGCNAFQGGTQPTGLQYDIAVTLQVHKKLKDGWTGGRNEIWTFCFYVTHINLFWTWDWGKKYTSVKTGKCCCSLLSLDWVVQQKSSFFCEVGNRMEKRTERTGKVVDKTCPAGARRRLLPKNINIKIDVSFTHTICLESS